MPYIDGFVAPVPAGTKDAYLEHARTAGGMFREHGIARSVECWSDDVPHGTQTDFYRSVQAKDDEAVVFAWMESPDKATRDAAMAKMMADERMKDMPMPFDGQRMIYGGFQPILDEGGGSGGYVDGFLVAVPNDKREAYRELSAQCAPVFLRNGAVRHMEAWADDVPDGKVTDFRRAVQAKDDESVVFSWIEWPDKATRDTGQQAAMKEMPGEMGDMPFDGKRMIFGGFTKILDL